MGYYYRRLRFQFALRMHLLDGERLLSGAYFFDPYWCAIFQCWPPVNDNEDAAAAPKKRDLFPNFVLLASALRARRRNSETLRIIKLGHPGKSRLDTVLENCIFYISPMYEFSHRLGHKAKNSM